MKITTVGLDLAKNVFQVHGVDQHGKVVLKKQLRRWLRGWGWSHASAQVVARACCWA